MWSGLSRHDRRASRLPQRSGLAAQPVSGIAERQHAIASDPDCRTDAIGQPSAQAGPGRAGRSAVALHPALESAAFRGLEKCQENTAVIHDPAFGVRKLSLAEVSNSFTGIALELWPNADFKQQEVKQHISLRAMMGRITGLKGALTQILLLAFGLELFSLISPLYMQWILDNVLVTADTNLLTTLAVGFGLLVLVQQTISTLRSWMLIYLGTT